ncbi:hypothetical protein [Streptomyces sp. NPDC051684]|uniref:hypothetical protein n=1 Tax=Streptomyces sp. NPDC051684 TaxID=3365670 RepID=UPI00379FEF61
MSSRRSATDVRSRSTRLRAATTVPVLCAVLAGGGLLTACGGDSDSGSSDAAAEPSTSAPAETTSPSAEPSASAEAVDDDAAAAGKPTAVNKSINDDVMKQKATVLKYVDGFQPSAAAKAKFSALEDEKVVLVQVKVTASSKYYTSFGPTSFRLTKTANGIDQASTTILDDEVAAAGYPALEDAKTGKSSTGWIVFTPSKDLDKLVLRYKRLAAKGSDGATIEAKNFDVPLD